MAISYVGMSKEQLQNIMSETLTKTNVLLKIVEANNAQEQMRSMSDAKSVSALRKEGGGL